MNILNSLLFIIYIIHTQDIIVHQQGLLEFKNINPIALGDLCLMKKKIKYM